MGINTKRDLKLDGLKFIMIFLVVLGHLSYNDWGLGVSKIIYSFHMPVFVFLSGYFTSLNTNHDKQNKWLRKTLSIYIIAQFVHFILSIGFGLGKMLLEHVPFDSSIISWEVIISPYLALWYLVCLIYWRLSVWYLLPKTNDIALLLISLGLALVSGFIPIDHEFAFQRAFSFFPYFVLGLVFKKHNLLVKLDELPYVHVLFGLVVGLIVSKFLPIYMPKFHYLNWHDLLLRLEQTCLGAFLCLCIIKVTHIDSIERFAKYGVYTLWIFIGHTYLIRIGEKAFPLLGISLNLIGALLLAALYCLVFYFMASLYQSKKQKKIERL